MKTKGFERKRRIIVGVSGASGAIYAYRLIQVLADSGIEVHFVASKAGLEVLEYECGLTMVQLTQMVHKIYDVNQIDSAIASGSFPCESMVIVPCSMKTLGSLANGIAGNLLTRAADVTLKEGRKLVLVTRETPVHAGKYLKKSIQAERKCRISASFGLISRRPFHYNVLVVRKKIFVG